MKFSKYNLLFTVDDKSYLYNILSTALVEIENDVVLSMERNNVSMLDSSLAIAMADLHFVVDDNADETQEYLYYFNSMKYRIGAKSLGLIFVPTYNCNLACPYCLQERKRTKR